MRRYAGVSLPLSKLSLVSTTHGTKRSLAMVGAEPVVITDKYLLIFLHVVTQGSRRWSIRRFTRDPQAQSVVTRSNHSICCRANIRSHLVSGGETFAEKS